MVMKSEGSSESRGSMPEGNISGGNSTSSGTKAKSNSSGNGSVTKQVGNVKNQVVEGEQMTKSICAKLEEKAMTQANDAKLEGNSVYKTGDYEKALLKYEHAIQTAPDGPLSTEIRSICYANRAACFSNLGKFEESVRECSKALELNPSYLKVLLRRGEAREKLRRYDESITDMTQILEFDPSNDQARINIVRLRPLADKKRKKMEDGMMGDTVGVDYISTLHEDILTAILSCLPFKEAVRTSILSVAWEFKWTSLCNVRIDDIDESELILKIGGVRLYASNKNKSASALANFVGRVLYLSNNMTSFYLKTKNECTPSLLTTWISTLLSRKVEIFDLALDIKPHYGNKAIVLPFSLLTNPSLQTFELKLTCTFNLHAVHCFPNLTKLLLHGVRLNGNCNTTIMSLNFPVLETFRTMDCNWVNVKSVEMHAPALTLFNTEPYDEFEDYSIKIFAPKLVKFQNNGYLQEDIVFEGSPVVTAHFDIEGFRSDLLRETGVKLRKQLNGLYSKLTELSLSKFMASALQSGGYPIQRFHKLELLLLLFPCKSQQVFEFLHATPMLSYLCIDVSEWDDCDYDGMDSTPSCIESHLEQVATLSFKGEPAQTKLLKFFMKNAGRLRRLLFEPSLIAVRKNLEERMSKAERYRILQLLYEYPKKSKNPLIFHFTSPERNYLKK